jgi:ribosome-associated protein
MKITEIKNIIEKVLEDNKAINIISINLKKKSYIADYMVIASGTSSRHLQALSELIVSELKKKGIANCRIEGKDSSEWKLVDATDIIVHIFHPTKRSFYDLEKMWSEQIPKVKAVI